MRNMRQFWSSRRIGEDRVTMIRLGPLRLWLARAEEEWGVAYEHGEVLDMHDISQVPEDVAPSTLHWTKTLFKNAPREYQLLPTVPDRPLVVKPSDPVRVPPGETGIFFCLLPVFLKVFVSQRKTETTLLTVPTRPLSDTWFGSPIAGELCYSLPIKAEQDISQLEPLPNHAVCRIAVTNRSHEVLQIGKLCYRPQYIGLYGGNAHLWASGIRIRHEGQHKGNVIHYDQSAPEDEADLLLLAKPVRREEKSLSWLTFSSSFTRDFVSNP